MDSKLYKYMRDNFMQIIANNARFRNPSISMTDVQEVLNYRGCNVPPKSIIYIRNLRDGWNSMLWDAKNSSKFTVESVDTLCLWNRVCMANLTDFPGDIIEAGSIVSTSSIDLYDRVLSFTYSEDFSTVEERACALYISILKANLFRDGNECVATLAASRKLLVENIGYFSVPWSGVDEVKRYMSLLYHSGESNEFMEYLLKNAIIGG